jgi:hypothetical protein
MIHTIMRCWKCCWRSWHEHGVNNIDGMADRLLRDRRIAYIAIELMSWTLFKEPVMPLQIIGSALILAGVWFISIASEEVESSIKAEESLS